MSALSSSSLPMLRALAFSVLLACAPLARGQDAAAAPQRFEVARTLTVPGGVTFAAAFAPNGTTLCTGGELGDVILWDLKTATARWRVQQSDHWIGEIAWPPAGDRVAVLGRELTIQLLERQRAVGEDARLSRRR